jgi:hypothetical protein
MLLSDTKIKQFIQNTKLYLYIASFIFFHYFYSEYYVIVLLSIHHKLFVRSENHEPVFSYEC